MKARISMLPMQFVEGAENPGSMIPMPRVDHKVNAIIESQCNQ